jgi:hypothetical protein
MPKTVERYSGPLTTEFFLELALQQRPMIIDGLFDGQPIRKIKTIADLPLAWANTQIRPRVQPERIQYPAKLLAPTTILKFLTDQAPGFVFDKILIPSFNPPFVLPESALKGGDPTTQFHYYMGNPGAFTHLHFDSNCRHNLHYQLIGKKRFLFFPEHRSKYLAPQQQSSRIFLERLTNEERISFTDYAGGYDCTLEPGDGLYMPPLIWHFIEYVEPGMSLSFRFGKSQHITNLHTAIGGFHNSVEFQHIALGLLCDESVSPVYKDAYNQLLIAIGEKYDFLRVQSKLEELCEKICPEKIECLYANWQDQSLAVS